MKTRREFLGATAAAVAGVAGAARLAAQEVVPPKWPSQVVDIHHHIRQNIESNAEHLDGCGVAKAVLLTPVQQGERAKMVIAKYPGRFWWFASSDVSRPDAEDRLTAAVKDGALGLGELKYHVLADGPELKRMYALAAELNVPITVHFQEYPHYEGEGAWASGWKRFESILKAYPRTKFIAHADAVWANVSVEYHDDVAYPATPIKPGGITDKWLSDYANLYADLSANSGNNALSRSPEFTKDFLVRHQDKLMFGSDCGCQDGAGKGNPPPNDPARATPNGIGMRLNGKCVARETLAAVERSAPVAIFKKITWDNAAKLLKLS